MSYDECNDCLNPAKYICEECDILLCEYCKENHTDCGRMKVL